MIRVKNTSKTYRANRKKTLEDITLDIERGDIYGIVGLSGAGKSSIVRCINSLEEFEEGKVLLDDVDMGTLDKNDLNMGRGKIGMIFQHFNLFNSNTVYDNIAFPLRLAKWSNEDVDIRVKELLDIIDLSGRANSYPSQLSGGQKQMVGIARAISNRPSILLCDEATSSLDPKTAGQILDLLKFINESTGITILVMTHDMEVIKKICNKLAILDHGRVIKKGDVIDLFSGESDEKIGHFTKYDFNIDPSLYSGLLLALTFNKDDAKEAVISKVFRDFNIDANVLSGNIEYLGGQALSKFLIEIDRTLDKEKIISRLNKYGVRVEEFN